MRAVRDALCRSLCVLIIGATCSLTPALTVRAAVTWYVDMTRGLDVPDCGIAAGASACRTLDFVIAHRITGDDGETVNVAAGTYPECNLTLPHAVNIVGADRDHTIFTGNKTCRVFVVPRYGQVVTMRDLTIADGYVDRDTQGGGGLLTRGVVTLTRVTLHGNRVNTRGQGYGGAINNMGGWLKLVECALSTNSATATPDGDAPIVASGGAIATNSTTTDGNVYHDGRLDIVHSVIASNVAESGGGIFDDGSTVTITTSEIRANRTLGKGAGGGFLSDESGFPLTVTDSLFTDNTAYAGSAIFTHSPRTLRLANSTFSGNTIAEGPSPGGVPYIPLGFGGTIHVTSLDPHPDTDQGMELLHVTIAGNAGGGLYSDDSALPKTIRNSIVADNTAGGGADCGGGGHPFASRDYNISSGTTCALTKPHDLPGTDPRLAPLAYNGGPTFTRALLPGSPAIDRIPLGTGAPGGIGCALRTDQRGVTRPQGAACDVGAYEFNGAGKGQ